ncbi:hypothetical protein V1525DRAFT_385207 [Lipomyces kononenkoae]|uniref:Uncharacterized protein n=1 Tax=Lipomyces kononenkoae TaxID=34357 RepID=A0ACC3TAD9_LIPKO
MVEDHLTKVHRLEIQDKSAMWCTIRAYRLRPHLAIAWADGAEQQLMTRTMNTLAVHDWNQPPSGRAHLQSRASLSSTDTDVFCAKVRFGTYASSRKTPCGRTTSEITPVKSLTAVQFASKLFIGAQLQIRSCGTNKV